MLPLALPNPSATELQNAARLAPFACAAYGCARSIGLMEEALKAAGGEWNRFAERHVHGLVAETADTVIVAIAGTDDREDWRNNRDRGRYRLGTFAKDYGVAINEANRDVEVHTGFVQVAYLVYQELRHRWPMLHHKPNVWIVGHSQGGAGAALLPVIWPALGAHVVTFGAPRVVSWRSRLDLSIASYKSHFRWVTIDDLVPQVPLFYRHPKTAQFRYLRYFGEPRHQLPRLDLFWRSVRRAWNFCRHGAINSINAAHSCRLYCDWLEVWR